MRNLTRSHQGRIMTRYNPRIEHGTPTWVDVKPEKWPLTPECLGSLGQILKGWTKFQSCELSLGLTTGLSENRVPRPLCFKTSCSPCKLPKLPWIGEFKPPLFRFSHQLAQETILPTEVQVLDQKLRCDMAKVIAHPPNLQRGQPTPLSPIWNTHIWAPKW